MRLKNRRRMALVASVVATAALMTAGGIALRTGGGSATAVMQLPPAIEIEAVPAEGRPVVRFTTLAPGTPLPSEEYCAALVQGHAWEPRPENNTANHATPSSVSLPAWTGVESSANTTIRVRIGGKFAGTTDEILRWGACKWGFDEDTVRAVAVQESSWRQSAVGDGGLSFGIMQVKRTAHPGTFPTARDSTAFNVDYALAWRRACYEGAFQWLNSSRKRGGYQAGDEWGCIGAWYSGDWYDEGARDYIQRVRRHYSAKPWLRSGF